MDGVNLTNSQAYAAMYDFLSSLYDELKSDELGSLLGSMSLLADGSTADPAMHSRWKKSVEKALTNKVDVALTVSAAPLSPED